jgi:hypothetical protein
MSDELEEAKQKAHEFGRRVAEAEDNDDVSARRKARKEWSAFWKEHFDTERHREVLIAYARGNALEPY